MMDDLRPLTGQKIQLGERPPSSSGESSRHRGQRRRQRSKSRSGRYDEYSSRIAGVKYADDAPADHETDKRSHRRGKSADASSTKDEAPTTSYNRAYRNSATLQTTGLGKSLNEPGNGRRGTFNTTLDGERESGIKIFGRKSSARHPSASATQRVSTPRSGRPPSLPSQSRPRSTSSSSQPAQTTLRREPRGSDPRHAMITDQVVTQFKMEDPTMRGIVSRDTFLRVLRECIVYGIGADADATAEAVAREWDDGTGAVRWARYLRAECASVGATIASVDPSTSASPWSMATMVEMKHIFGVCRALYNASPVGFERMFMERDGNKDRELSIEEAKALLLAVCPEASQEGIACCIDHAPFTNTYPPGVSDVYKQKMTLVCRFFTDLIKKYPLVSRVPGSALAALSAAETRANEELAALQAETGVVGSSDTKEKMMIQRFGRSSPPYARSVMDPIPTGHGRNISSSNSNADLGSAIASDILRPQSNQQGNFHRTKRHGSAETDRNEYLAFTAPAPRRAIPSSHKHRASQRVPEGEAMGTSSGRKTMTGNDDDAVARTDAPLKTLRFASAPTTHVHSNNATPAARKLQPAGEHWEGEGDGDGAVVDAYLAQAKAELYGGQGSTRDQGDGKQNYAMSGFDSSQVTDIYDPAEDVLRHSVSITGQQIDQWTVHASDAVAEGPRSSSHTGTTGADLDDDSGHGEGLEEAGEADKTDEVSNQLAQTVRSVLAIQRKPKQRIVDLVREGKTVHAINTEMKRSVSTLRKEERDDYFSSKPGAMLHLALDLKTPARARDAVETCKNLAVTRAPEFMKLCEQHDMYRTRNIARPLFVGVLHELGVTFSPVALNFALHQCGEATDVDVNYKEFIDFYAEMARTEKRRKAEEQKGSSGRVGSRPKNPVDGSRLASKYAIATPTAAATIARRRSTHLHSFVNSNTVGSLAGVHDEKGDETSRRERRTGSSTAQARKKKGGASKSRSVYVADVYEIVEAKLPRCWWKVHAQLRRFDHDKSGRVKDEIFRMILRKFDMVLDEDQFGRLITHWKDGKKKQDGCSLIKYKAFVDHFACKTTTTATRKQLMQSGTLSKMREPQTGDLRDLYAKIRPLVENNFSLLRRELRGQHRAHETVTLTKFLATLQRFGIHLAEAEEDMLADKFEREGGIAFNDFFRDVLK